VGDILQDIRSGQTPLTDVDAEGFLVYNAGYILLWGGHLDLAEEAFQVLNASFPEVGAGHIGLGDVYMQREEVAAAIESYERAIELGAYDLRVENLIAELQSQEP
jgi:tetratricopeptide (TPR) repeat protein